MSADGATPYLPGFTDPFDAQPAPQLQRAPAAPSLPGFTDPFDAQPAPQLQRAPAAPSLPGFTDPFDPATAAERVKHSTLGDVGRALYGSLVSNSGNIVQDIGAIKHRVEEFAQREDAAHPVLRRIDNALGFTPANADQSGSSTIAAGKRLQNYGNRIATNVKNPNNPLVEAAGTIGSIIPATVGTLGATALGTLAGGPAGGAAAGVAAGASLFGAQGEAAGRNAGEEQVAALTPEQLAKVPGYGEALQQGMTPDQFRARLSEKAASRGALVQGAEGAALGLLGEIPGVRLLGRMVASKLTRPIGETAARIVGKGVGEAVGFGGINAAGQVVSNLANPIPTSPTAGVGQAFASGLLPGAALGAGRAGIAHLLRPSITATGEPFPGAAAGSMADAANTLHRNTGAAAETPTSALETQPPITRKMPPPPVPWLDAATGEHRTPTATEVIAAFHRMADDQAQANANNVKLVTGLSQLSDAWGVPLERLKSLRKVAINERAKGVTTRQAEQRAAEDFAQHGTTNTFQQADLGLHDLNTQANAVQASLAEARARIDQQQAARSEPPAAETPALQSVAIGKQDDANRQPTQPGEPAAPSAEAAPAPSEVRPSPEISAASAEPDAGQAAPAPSGAGSTPVDQAAEAVPVSSSNPPKAGIEAETTSNIGEMQATPQNNERIKQYFDNLRNEVGWDEVGGRLLRAGDESIGEGGLPPVIGRTKWVPKPGSDGEPSTFWRMRPSNAKLSEKQALTAFDKAARGEKLKPIEQRFIDYAQQTAHDYAKLEAEETARFEAEQRDMDETSRPEATEYLRQQETPVAPQEENDALTLDQWAKRAHDAGVGVNDAVWAAHASPDPREIAQRFSRLIAEKEQENAPETRNGRGDRASDVQAPQGRAVDRAKTGGQRARQESGAGAEPRNREAAAREALALTPSERPETGAPSGPSTQQGQLLRPPTGGERVAAAAREKDDQRNGKTGAVIPGFIGTDLGAGPAPDQTRMPTRFALRTVGAKGLVVQGIRDDIRAALRAGGFKKHGSAAKDGVRFDASDRPAIERAMGLQSDNVTGQGTATFATLLRGAGTRKSTLAGAARVDAARRVLRDAINDTRMAPAEKADAIAKLRDRVQFMETHAGKSELPKPVEAGEASEATRQVQHEPVRAMGVEPVRSVDEAAKLGAAPVTSNITDIGEKIGGARKDTAVKTGRAPRADKDAEGSAAKPGWMNRYEVSQIASSSRVGEQGRWTIHDKRQKGVRGHLLARGTDQTFATKEEAEAAIPIIALVRNHGVGRREEGNYGIYRRVTDRKRVWLKDGFATPEDAKRYMAQHAKDLIETKTSVGEEALPKPETVTRQGPARRTADVKPEEFRDTFGFRGVEFGNWNSQGERQEVMNRAFDGLHDLAELLGIPPKAISLNGELGLAFGARGQGLTGARAHYERDHVVMNLTKMQGAGALAHEWFHALDHYLGRESGTTSKEWRTLPDGTRVLKTTGDVSRDMASYSADRASKLRDELRQAYATLINTMQRTATRFVRDTAKLERFTGNARGRLEEQLTRLRDELAQAQRYGTKGKMAPASAEQLAEFDAIAQRMVRGENLELRTEANKAAAGRKFSSGYRTTNDDLNRLSAIMKAVRGRAGFSADGHGIMNKIAGLMRAYDVRLKEAADARANPEADTIKPTSFRMEAIKADQGRGTNYWSTHHEMAARAFSAYVEDKLTGEKRTSDFLSYGSKEHFVLPIPEFPHPFPGGDERVAIDKAFDAFFKTVKTKEDEAGNVGLFSKPEPRLPDDPVPSPDGDNDFGEITAAQGKSMRRQAGKIRLPLGEQKPDGTGFGLAHIEANHGKQIRRAGFKSVEDFVHHIARHVDQIWRAPVGQLVLLAHGEPPGVMFLRMQPARDANGDYYRVNTAFPVRDADYGTRKGWEKLWDGSEPPSSATGTRTAFAATPGNESSPGRPNAVRQSLNKSTTNAKTGLDRPTVQRLVDATTAKWGDNKPKVHVVDTPAEFPDSARTTDGFDMANHAYYDGRDIWLARSNLRSPQDVLKAMAHEPVHYALDRIMDQHVKGGWKKFTADIDRLRRDPALGSKAMRDAINEVERRYPGADADTFARELPAVMAERGVKNGILARAVEAIRAFLRRIMPGTHPTEKMALDLLHASNKYLHDDSGYRKQVKMVQAHAFSETPDTFYSALSEAVNKAKGAPRSADAAAWKQWLDGAQRRGEFKGAEREWMGLDGWLDQHKGPITRADLNDFVRQNQVHVQEVVHGDEPPINAADIRENEDGTFDLVDEGGGLATAPERPTKFGDYTLPGGENYRELLLTLPAAERKDQFTLLNNRTHGTVGAFDSRAEAEAFQKTRPDLAEHEVMHAGTALVREPQQPFRSGHFEKPNILAHVRFNDRTGPDGEKILHVEEVQSDWHQAARKKGYADKPDLEKPVVVFNAKTGENVARFKDGKEAEAYIASRDPKMEMLDYTDTTATGGMEPNKVPDAPFKKEWPMLAMKRVLRWAADNGYDKVTWTTGEQQAERYDLSKSIDRLIYMPKNDGGLLFAYGKDGRQVLRQANVKPDALSDYVGKEAAQKLIDQPTSADQAGQDVKQLKGADLKLGGEGMKAFYDKMLPNELNKYVKQWGAKVGDEKIAVANMSPDEFEQASRQENNPNVATVHSLDITPAMRESVRQGQPLFARADLVKYRDEHPFDGDVNAAQPSQASDKPTGAFSKGAPAEADEYRRQLDGALRVKGNIDKHLVVGRTPEVLREKGGLPDLSLRIKKDTVLKATAGERMPALRTDEDAHQVTLDAMRHLPELLSDPIMILKSRMHTGSVVVLTDAKDMDGHPIIVAIHPNEKSGFADINRVASVYGKDGVTGFIRDDIRGKRVLWTHPQKGPEWLRSRGLQLPKENATRGSEASVEPQEPEVKSTPPQKPKGSFSKPAPVDPSREPARGMEDLDKVLKEADPGGVVQYVKDWVTGKLEDLRPAALGTLQTQHLLEIMEHSPPLKQGAGHYDRSRLQLNADREQLMVGAADATKHPKDMLKKGAVTIAQELRTLGYGKGLKSLLGRVSPEAKRLFNIMHQATLQRMDPSTAYERLTIENAHGDAVPWTKEGVKERLKLLRELTFQRGGDPDADREKMRDEIKYLRNLPKMEAQRERDWPKLQADYKTLSPEAKRLYGEVRDWYSQYRDATEKALIHNIEAMDMPETYQQSLVNRMRLQFEEQRREGVYFPLNRDGDYWVSFSDKEGNEGFKMFEQYKDMKAGVKRLNQAGMQIDAFGRRTPNAKAAKAPSGTFVRSIIDTLQKANVSEKVQDEVYQTFLRAMPELSMRKHSIHRRNIAGFSEDALRAFAKNGYHGAHQLARLRHAQDMQLTLDAMQMGLDSWRRGENATDESPAPDPKQVVKADVLIAELNKRHEWIMSPNDQQLATMANSIGFVWYLGASPASAITNLTQIAQTAAPLLGARHGWPKASRMLWAAWRDASRTVGHMDKVLTNKDEKRAFLEMQQRGDFSKTQVHTLAGLAEGGVLQTSPTWAKTMNAVSWMFHTAELVNREATGMAAYRLARADGMGHDEAVAYAGKVNAQTNFDYSAGNRPRYMQNNFGRIAFQFKNYSIGMTWLYFSNAWKAFTSAIPREIQAKLKRGLPLSDAETKIVKDAKDERRIALRTVAGITGMTALLAGATGLPLYSTVRFTANAANALFGDDDEPWNFDDAFHRWLADGLGPEAAHLIAEGPTNYLTGANLSSRTSMSNLWIRHDDAQLEGADAYHALLENLAGPMGGIVQNFYVGGEEVRRGNLERGIERMLPTAVKNTIKSYRYAAEGVNSLRGDPIVPDVTGYEEFLQAIGFQPSKVANQYRINTAEKNYTREVKARRRNLMNAYAIAAHHHDHADEAAAMGKIREFNRAHPEIPVTRPVLQVSLRQRARLSAQAEHGIIMNRRLQQGAQEYVGAQQ